MFCASAMFARLDALPFARSGALSLLLRLGALSLTMACTHCVGNTGADAMMPQSTADGTQGIQGSDGSTIARGSNPNTDPNATTTNANTTATGKGAGTASCASMPGPCSTTLTAIPLTGCSSADYQAKVTLGGNQVLNLLVDTGSTTLAVADASCDDCQGVTPTYTPGGDAQSTGTAVKSTYGTGNGWTGTAESDTVQITSGIKALQMRFARITDQTTTAAGVGFFSGSDCTGNTTDNAHQGIFGMGNAMDALPGTDTYLDVLKASGQVSDAFAFEACDSGGRLWLGGYDPTSVSAAPVFTPLDTSQGYDLVTLSGIGIGQTQLNLTATDFGKTLVDTGTSIFLLPTAAFDTLTSSIEADPNYSAVMPKGFLSSSQFISAGTAQAQQLDALLPPMHLSFPGVNGQATITVDLPASESYLTPFTYQGQPGYLSGISPVSSKSPTTVLGNSTMHSHVLIFDRANLQLGYGPHSTCP